MAYTSGSHSYIFRACFFISPSLPRLVDAFANSFENKILGRLNTVFGSYDLDGLVIGLITGHLDLATALLADRVNSGPIGADDVAPCTRIRQNQVAGSIALLGLFNSLLDHLNSLGDILGCTTKDPWNFPFFTS